MGNNKRPGRMRRPRPDRHNLCNTVAIHLTDDELRTLAEAANDSRLNLSDWIKIVALKEVGGIAP